MLPTAVSDTVSDIRRVRQEVGSNQDIIDRANQRIAQDLQARREAINPLLPRFQTAGDGQIDSQIGQRDNRLYLPGADQGQETVRNNNAASTRETVVADTSLFNRGILGNLNQARKSFISYAQSHFPASVRNAETGKEIGISRKGLDKFLSGRVPYAKYASGFHIPELIERAHKVSGADNFHEVQSDSIPTYEYYDSPITIDGKPYSAHIRVRNTRMGDRYYGHTVSEVEDIEIEPSARASVPEDPAVQPVNAVDSSTSYPSILQPTQEVNQAVSPDSSVGAAQTGLGSESLPETAVGAEKISPWVQFQASSDEFIPEGANAARPVDVPTTDPQGRRIRRTACPGCTS